MCPLKTFQLRTKYAQWVTENMKQNMKERNDLQKRATISQDKNIWRQYKKVRNRVVSHLRLEERAWQRIRLRACEIHSNSSKTWKTVKNILNWTSPGSPDKLFYKGELKTKSIDVANAQNKFFIEKVQNIKDVLPVSHENPLVQLQQLMKMSRCL